MSETSLISTENPTLSVSVGILFNQANQVFITKRATNTFYGSFWEFPGGKIEQGETPSQALVREIKEELDINVQSYDYLGIINQYTQQCLIQLHAFKVANFEGVIKLQAYQSDSKWVESKDLANHPFPEATVKLITRYLNA